MLAPVIVPVFVIEPASHAAQSLAAFEPVVLANRPVPQSVHLSTLDAVEYFPTPHAVQVVAPLLVPLMEPASQAEHDSTADDAEYSPAAHSSHELAPTAVPVFVRDPAKHTLQ
jgi:hypothetical protein